MAVDLVYLMLINDNFIYVCYVNDSVHTVDNWILIYNKSFMGTFDYKKVSRRMEAIILISDSIRDWE